MATKKLSVKISRRKSRVPVPKKPPKIEKSEKVYNRKKLKSDLKQEFNG